MSSSTNSEEENTDSKPIVEKDNETKLETDLKSHQMEETINPLSSTTEEETNDIFLPSDIDWKDYIHNPPSFINEEEKSNGGKWLLFANGDLDKVDGRWVVLQSLYENGTLVRIKSSTAFDTVRGVTMCYTSNFENKEEVKRAADEIRKLINYEHPMHYKTNEASVLGLYRDSGDSGISMYMHTFRGGFYERDKFNRWTRVEI